MLAAAVSARVAVMPGPTAELLALLAASGVLSLMVAIATGYEAAAYWAVGVVAAAYATSVVAAGSVDGWSVAVAITLLLSSELATWSIDSRRRGRDDLAVHLLRLRTILLVAAVALAAALVTQDAAIFGPGGVGVAALAVAAVLAAIAAIGLMLARPR